MPNTRPSPTEQQQREARYRNWEELTAGVKGEDCDDPEPYVDLILKDPVVCSSCFLYRYDVVSKDWWRGEFGWMSYEKWEARPGASARIPADGPSSRGTRLVCKNCGTPNDDQKRPVPARFVDEYAENLSATLRTKGITHDRDVLLSEVIRRNQSSDVQGRQDTAVFSPAVEAAIRVANERGQTASHSAACD